MPEEYRFKEERFVIEPLMLWLKKAGWELQKPSHPTSAKGWDIEARRRKECLLIEAKYISGSSISSLAGLVAAPLAKRDKRWNDPSWCCWAIGMRPQVERRGRHMYQIFFDYMARNSEFWKHYGEDLRMKYIFCVQAGEVTRIPFAAFLRMAKLYGGRANEKTPLEDRRRIAEGLLSRHLKRAVS